MNIKNYLSKKKFSLQQVVGFLALILIGVTALSYAAVNIPYTFSSGTIAKASEVNANFQALANAMPAVKTTGTTYLTNIDINSTTPSSIANITVNAPSSESIIIFASGMVGIKRKGLAQHLKINMRLSDTPGDINFGDGYSVYEIPPENTIPSISVPYVKSSLNIVRVFPIASPGSYTYHLNASLEVSATDIIGVVEPALTALYVPSQL
jgi:hypothetical protein